ncbi:hypothetical protein I4U23_027862 [Adineta vaga]|nr:hypothetical protein I4U23_027862 [Adineta vaga]
MEYISSPVDVYQCFNQQNQRIQYLLKDFHYSIDIFWEKEQYFHLTNSFANNYYRLRIFNICPRITLHHFSNLRSLTMTQPNNTQIHSVQPITFPFLEYLATPATLDIFNNLFGDSQHRWAFLYSCNFFTHIPTPQLNWTFNNSILILSGITCSRKILSQLLYLVPCLKYLRVDMITNDQSKWIIPLTIEHLLSLRISFYRLIYEDLMILIGRNLSHLYLEVYDDHIPIEFSSLGILFMSIGHKLKKFNCDYRGYDVDLEEIQSSHLFFRNIQLIPSLSTDMIKLFLKNIDL